MLDKLYSVAELSNILKIKKKTLYNHLKNDNCPFIIDRVKKFKLGDVLRSHIINFKFSNFVLEEKLKTLSQDFKNFKFVRMEKTYFMRARADIFYDDRRYDVRILHGMDQELLDGNFKIFIRDFSINNAKGYNEEYDDIYNGFIGSIDDLKSALFEKNKMINHEFINSEFIKDRLTLYEKHEIISGLDKKYKKYKSMDDITKWELMEYIPISNSFLNVFFNKTIKHIASRIELLEYISPLDKKIHSGIGCHVKLQGLKCDMMFYHKNGDKKILDNYNILIPQVKFSGNIKSLCNLLTDR